jgi:hypothetical protein
VKLCEVGDHLWCFEYNFVVITLPFFVLDVAEMD